MVNFETNEHLTILRHKYVNYSLNIRKKENRLREHSKFPENKYIWHDHEQMTFFIIPYQSKNNVEEVIFFHGLNL